MLSRRVVVVEQVIGAAAPAVLDPAAVQRRHAATEAIRAYCWPLVSQLPAAEAAALRDAIAQGMEAMTAALRALHIAGWQLPLGHPRTR